MRNNPMYYLDLIYVLTLKEMKVKYKSSILGYLWSLAHPFALAIAFLVAFKMVMKFPMENYALFLISGLFPWQWFSNSVCFSSTVFLANAPLVKKVNFPKAIVPLVTVLNEMMHFLFSIPVLLFLTLYYGLRPSVSWLYGIPLLCVAQFSVTYGITLVVSSVNLFFRDLERLVNVLTTLLLYMTPILYSEDMVPEGMRNLLLLNPIASLIIGWRNLFLKGVIQGEVLLHSSVSALVFLTIGYLSYRRLSPKFAEAL